MIRMRWEMKSVAKKKTLAIFCKLRAVQNNTSRFTGGFILSSTQFGAPSLNCVGFDIKPPMKWGVLF